MGVRAARRRGGSKSPAAGDGARSRQPRAAGARPAEDVPAILQAIARTAARLCEATDAHIYRVEGDQLRLVAIHGLFPRCAARPGDPDHREAAERLRRPRAPGDPRARYRDGRRPPPISRAPRRPRDVRTMLVGPLLRDDHAVGLIIIQRTRSAPFTAKQIALLRTFADQAAIALENERLREALEGAEPRADGRARARDRDGRDPADHLEVADRRAAGPRRPSWRARPGSATRRSERWSGSTGSC